jgi:2'-5' RNA ligase
MRAEAGETRLRLFVALELPEAARQAMSAWATSELARVEGLRLLSDEALHVTLCFLGATPAPEVDPIAAACREATAGHGPLRLSLGDALALPRRRPRVIAVGVAGAGDESDGEAAGAGEVSALAALQASLSASLRAGGWYRPESRPFLAHVTVARVRSRSRISARALESLPRIEVPVLVADTVTLFRSHTRPGGAQYEALARVALGG